MNTDQLSDLLRSLPPSMDDPLDRYEAVRRRARRRARRIRVGVGGAAAATVVATAAAVLVGTPPTRQSSDLDVTTQPPSPTGTVRYEEVGALPGSTEVVDLTEPVSVIRTGTAVVDLGARPDAATAANVSVVCLTAGRIVYPDGASIVCDSPASASEVADPRRANHALVDLAPGQTSLRFRARDDVGWKVVVTYARTETSDWGVNADGETFGVARDGESPDLVAVYASNGRLGYAYAEDLDRPLPTSPADALAQQEAHEGQTRSVTVYESDGETVVGDYVSGP